MDVNNKLDNLEGELKLIKGELKQTLIEVRDFLLNLKLPPAPVDQIFADAEITGQGGAPPAPTIELSGKIFSFDDLPVIVPDTGEKGIPGQAINCGCTMRPVYVFPEGEQ